MAFAFIVETGDLTVPEFHQQNENNSWCLASPFSVVLGWFPIKEKCCFSTFWFPQVPSEYFYCPIFHASYGNHVYVAMLRNVFYLNNNDNEKKNIVALIFLVCLVNCLIYFKCCPLGVAHLAERPKK